MLGIQPLSADLVNLIAAGQVIDSPAAVVRELVENALDAGAQKIVLQLWLSCWRITVADNGIGINPQDLQACGEAHSTSKIRDREDLEKINTLGFRGEALHSLIQLGDVEIYSRHRDTPQAYKVSYKQGEKQETVQVAIAPGTIINVTNLFYNCPSRRQSLGSLTQQQKAVQATIAHIALTHPHVTWETFNEGQSWWNISSGDDATTILPQLLKQIHASDLQYSKYNIPDRTEEYLEILIGLPDRCYRRKPDWVKIALNGRMIQSPPLTQSVLAAFSKTLPRDRHPICFLHIHIAPSYIDWHRHPAKT